MRPMEQRPASSFAELHFLRTRRRGSRSAEKRFRASCSERPATRDGLHALENSVGRGQMSDEISDKR
jgi:hypothetical protein